MAHPSKARQRAGGGVSRSRSPPSPHSRGCAPDRASLRARHRHRIDTLIAAATVALVAPLAVVATTLVSAEAAPPVKHKHEVTMYKVEKHLTLSGVGSQAVGDSGTQSLSCDAGDYVLDGMWMVSHVDQYNPDPPDPDDDPDNPPVDESGVYDDMKTLPDRTIHGTTPWQEIALVLDVPAGADSVITMLRVCGTGSAWFGPAVVEVVPSTVPTTPHVTWGFAP